jgi:very-short-patch-repair endonuclease
MPSLSENIASRVTVVTPPVLRWPAAGLSFVDGSRNAPLRRPLCRARRGAQRSSPLAPLLRPFDKLRGRWRGKGHTGLVVPKIAKTRFARYLRERETFTEKIAWNLLRRHGVMGLKFKRQFVVGNFILDFYCPQYKLAIEIDGSIHEHRKEYDAARQAILEREGLHFIRITAEEMETYPETLIDRIRAFVAGPHSSPHSPLPLRKANGRRGGGGEERCAPRRARQNGPGLFPKTSGRPLTKRR